MNYGTIDTVITAIRGHCHIGVSVKFSSEAMNSAKLDRPFWQDVPDNGIGRPDGLRRAAKKGSPGSQRPSNIENGRDLTLEPRVYAARNARLARACGERLEFGCRDHRRPSPAPPEIT